MTQESREFLGCTIGLECNYHEMRGKLVCAEYLRNPDQTVTLMAASGRTGRQMPGWNVTLTAEQYENRPTDPYNNVPEARWALNLLGWSLMSDDYEEKNQ